MKKNVYVTESDMKRLRGMLANLSPVAGLHSAYVRDLTEELNRAVILKDNEVRKDVITMNSTVRLTDLDSGETVTLTLVFPHAADIERNRISILAPIGTGMLGYAVGDTFEWRVPGGLKHMRVEEIVSQPEYEPEADGAATE